MNRCFRRGLLLPVLPAIVLWLSLWLSPEAEAQTGVRDSVYLIEQITGQPYECCFGFILKSRQIKPQKIDEFVVKLVDSRARFITGQSSSPPGWTVFQNVDSVRWLANTAVAELDSGEEANSFNVCAKDTGVTRLVWETRYLGVLVSSDTLKVVCRGTFCDEPFFSLVPSSQVCAIDIDLVAANGEDRIVNDFHVQIVDSGVTFHTTLGSAPPGWTRIKANADTISFRTFTAGLAFGKFVEDFRVFVNAKKDSTFRIEWWTTNFGETLCRDTVTLKCGLSISDTFTITKTTVGEDTCCQDIEVRNTHFPKSKLNGFAVKVLTPKAKIKPGSLAAQGWTTTGLNAAGDSITFLTSEPLNYRDSALFRSICFINDSARVDTVRYRLETFGAGVTVTTATTFRICERRQLNCDSITVVVDSTYPATRRCLRFTVKNANSRGDEIQRIVFRFNNPGTRRSIVAATAPAGRGWIATFAGDSAVFSGSFLSPKESLSGFDVCLSMGDDATQDPVTITWSTSNDERPVCDGLIEANAIIERVCDELTTTELPGEDAVSCCFEVTVHNRNQFNRAIDRFLLDIPGSNIIFTGGQASSGWTLTTEALPNFSLEFNGGSIAPGDSARFQFCLNVSQLGQKPFNVPPIAWTTRGGGQLICVDTLRLVCRGVEPVDPICDTVKVITSTRDDAQGVCTYGLNLVNRHNQSPGPINGLRLRITQGNGGFAAALPGVQSWSAVTLTRTEVVFRGSNIRSLDSLNTLRVSIDGSDGNPITIEAATLFDDNVICAHPIQVRCDPGTVGVEIGESVQGFRLFENRPNPFATSTSIGYELTRSGNVTLIVRDQSGAEARRIERGMEVIGEHRITLDMSDLPSGIYYYTLSVGNEALTRRMVLLR